MCQLSSGSVKLCKLLAYIIAGQLQHWVYLVPDDVLETASNILSDIGLPLTPAPKLLVESKGDFDAKAHLHRITRSTSMSAVQYIQLLPLSFPSFSHSELTPTLPLPSLATPRSNAILYPNQPAVYASIIRTMLAYPIYCATRSVLESNLSELIGYNLYDLQIGYVDLDDEDLCQELELDRRVDDALHVVKGWGWDGAWREEEEWMGDALAAIVAGRGEIEWLPWAPQCM
jgi:hypothetical protein